MQNNNNRETRIRTVRICGVPINVSNQTGGLLIWGKRNFLGRSFTFYGPGSTILYGSFATYRWRGEEVYALSLSRLALGNYWSAMIGIDAPSVMVTVTSSGWVEQVDLR